MSEAPEELSFDDDRPGPKEISDARATYNLVSDTLDRIEQCFRVRSDERNSPSTQFPLFIRIHLEDRSPAKPNVPLGDPSWEGNGIDDRPGKDRFPGFRFTYKTEDLVMVNGEGGP